MCVHFLWCDEDGGFTIRFAKRENPMLNTNFMAICWTEHDVLPIEVLHCGKIISWPFHSCDLDLDTLTFIHNSMHSPWKYTACACMNYVQQCFQNLSRDRHTLCPYATKIIYHAALWVVNINITRHIVIYHVVIFQRSKAPLFQLPTTGNCLWLLAVLVLVPWRSMSRPDVEQVFLK